MTTKPLIIFYLLDGLNNYYYAHVFSKERVYYQTSLNGLGLGLVPLPCLGGQEGIWLDPEAFSSHTIT